MCLDSCLEAPDQCGLTCSVITSSSSKTDLLHNVISDAHSMVSAGGGHAVIELNECGWEWRLM